MWEDVLTSTGDREPGAVLVLRPGTVAIPTPWEAGRSAEFASCWTPYVEQRRAALRDFGLRFGPLGIPHVEAVRPPGRLSLVGPSGQRGSAVEGEALDDWEQECHEAWACIQAFRRHGYLALSESAAAQLAGAPDAPLGGLLRLFVDEVGAPGPLVETQRLLNAALQRHFVVPLLVGDGLPFQWTYEPATLGGRIWYELALFATGETTVSLCLSCGRPMLYLHSYLAKGSKRDGAKYCSDACKVRHWRGQRRAK